MRYGLLSTAAVAALALSVAAGIAQTSGSGSGAGGSSGGSGAAASPSGGAARPTAGAPATGSGSQQSTQSGTSGTQSGTSGTSGSQTGQAGASGQSGSSQAGTSGTHSGTTTGTVPANITSEQRTQITRSFSSVHVAPATNVNFAISTGTVVPASVEWHDLPVEVVRVVPAYRGYKYILVGNRIVIIEPGTRKIVTVIERTA